MVTSLLKKYNGCIIIDFHSFLDEMVKKIFNIANTSDICIDNTYVNEKLINFIIEHLKNMAIYLKLITLIKKP